MGIIQALLYALMVAYFGIPPGYWTFQLAADYSWLPGVTDVYKTHSMTFDPLLISSCGVANDRPIERAMRPASEQAPAQLLPPEVNSETPLRVSEALKVPLEIERPAEAEDPHAMMRAWLRKLRLGAVTWYFPRQYAKDEVNWPGINSDNGFISSIGISDEQIKHSVVQLAKKTHWAAADRTIVRCPRQEGCKQTGQTEFPLLFEPLLWHFDPDSRVLKLKCTPIRTWTECVNEFTAPHEEAAVRRSFLEFLVEYREPAHPTREFGGLRLYR